MFAGCGQLVLDHRHPGQVPPYVAMPPKPALPLDEQLYAGVIGQPEAVELAAIAASQRRHLLLVGPPGTGKSMIAQALALHLAQPEEEIRVVHNPENPERPMIQVRTRDSVEDETEIENLETADGEIIDPKAAPQAGAW